jgi:hypothetical protein
MKSRKTCGGYAFMNPKQIGSHNRLSTFYLTLHHGDPWQAAFPQNHLGRVEAIAFVNAENPSVRMQIRRVKTRELLTADELRVFRLLSPIRLPWFKHDVRSGSQLWLAEDATDTLAGAIEPIFETVLATICAYGPILIKRRSSGPSGNQWFKVVAGVGFEPTTFRL